MQLEHEHSLDAIRKRLGADPKAGYVQNCVYGGIDGSITTFAIVAGTAGASFFAIGTAKSRCSIARWWRSRTEVLATDMSAALIAHAVGGGLEAIL